MPEFLYTIGALSGLAANGVQVAAVEFALNTGPQVRRWLDDRTLSLVARDQTGTPLLIVAIEGDAPDTMIIVYARYLNDGDTADLPEGDR